MDRAALRRLQRDKGDTAGIWIATPHPGHVDGHYHDSVVNTLLYDAHNGQRIVKWGCVCTMETSPRIASARNDMVEEFLKTNLAIPPEWLLFIDSDMRWSADDFELFASTLENEPDIKILGGLCFGGGRGSKAFPTLYILTDAKDTTLDRAEDYPDNEIVKVSATGAAFVAIHRDVLLDMKQAYGEVDGKKNTMIWFRDGTSDGKEYGEDIWFCLTAMGAGYDTFVHTGVKIGHMKRFDLNEAHYQENRTDG